MEQIEGELQPRWYATAVRMGREDWVCSALADQGLEPFVPKHVEQRRWSDRVKRLCVPVFPGYVFVKAYMCAATRVRMLAVKNAFDLVGRIPGDERIARHIPESEIDSLRSVYTSEYGMDPLHRLTVGASVVVISGPLRGARGIIEIGADMRRRLVVNVTLLGRGIRTVLSEDDIVRDDS